ncbi:MAG: heparinase II/III family protein [Gammaproteobacteria bacterium]
MTTFAPPIQPAVSMLGPGEFRFLHETHLCATPADWTSAEFSKLWRYNLHYFDDLNADHADERGEWHARLIARWITENPPGHGDGWEPYPLSKRIVNWIKLALRGVAIQDEVADSLATQTRWLRQRLEYHILGNHLFANAKALTFAGTFFSGDEADQWHAAGRAIVDRELREQVLDDGGHFELSPMYHAAFLEDLLDIVNLYQACARPVPPTWVDMIQRMRTWLATMSHPDHRIAFFNDAAFGIAPELEDIDAYCRRLAINVPVPNIGVVRDLPDSGYVRADTGRASLLCDCAAVGPDHQPGHAHADTLTFELSLGKDRVIVNSGTSEYGASDERLRQRGTAAHNCIVIDGQNSSEVWAGFRVARRARVTAREIDATRPIRVSAAHDGYRRLRGRNLQSRIWELADDALQIDDTITGVFTRAEAFFHLHPGVDATQTGPHEITLQTMANGGVTMRFEPAAAVSLIPDTWHPCFGVVRESRTVRVVLSGDSLRTTIRWSAP